jgi:hypothetical protein
MAARASGLATIDDPTLLVPGDPAAVRAQSTAWRVHAREVTEAAAGLAAIDIGGWMGAGSSAFLRASALHAARLKKTAAAYDEAAEVLVAHAAELEAARRAAGRAVSEWQRGDAATEKAQREQERLQTAMGGLLALAPARGAGGFVFADPGEPIRRNAVALLGDALDAAAAGEDRAVHRLRSLAKHPVTGSVFTGRAVPDTVAAILRLAKHDALLRKLQSMTPAELTAYAAKHPGLLDSLLILGPDRIFAWWSSLDTSARRKLTDALPRVIGNLDGIPPAIRDQVNSAQLTKDLAAADAAVTAARAALDTTHPNQTLVTLALQRLADAEHHRDELKAIRKAYGAGPTGPTPRQLYAYQPGAFTKVAISTGLLDDATHVSVIVPGMSTTALDSRGYAEAARSLRVMQSEFAQVNASRIAVLSWLDYDPPRAAAVWGVSHDELAAAGGDRLSSTLRGLQTVKEWGPQSPGLSVVAHSYGTNVTAFALNRPDTSAGAVVLLGSAGITDSVAAAPQLNVPSGQVFASQGAHDGWAPIGQALSGRPDPTDPRFGAHVFTSEGTSIDGRVLDGVTKHGPFGGADGVSYLNNGSSSQYATVKVTMGQGSELVYAGTPLDRFSTLLGMK